MHDLKTMGGTSVNHSSENSGGKRRRDEPEEEEFDIEDLEPVKRRRNDARDPQVKAKARQRAAMRLLQPVDTVVEDAEGDDELIDIDGVGQVQRSLRGNAKPDQIRFYTGETLVILLDARNRVRFYLFTVNPFPTGVDLLEKVKEVYEAACVDQYGSRHKGKCMPLNVLLLMYERRPRTSSRLNSRNAETREYQALRFLVPILLMCDGDWAATR